MMLLGNELLANGAPWQARQLDEDLFFEVFKESNKKKRVGRLQVSGRASRTDTEREYHAVK